MFFAQIFLYTKTHIYQETKLSSASIVNRIRCRSFSWWSLFLWWLGCDDKTINHEVVTNFLTDGERVQPYIHSYNNLFEKTNINMCNVIQIQPNLAVIFMQTLQQINDIFQMHGNESVNNLYLLYFDKITCPIMNENRTLILKICKPCLF